MSPSVERPEPPYLQIVGQIRAQIESGELRDGALIPSARTISRDWGVSLATATKALATLRSEGLVRGVPGAGTVVTFDNAFRAGKDRVSAIRRTGRIYPPNERAEIKSAELVQAPAQVADALGLSPGSAVIRRHRVTRRDDKPVSASVSWFDGSLAENAPRLLETGRLKQGTSRYIEETTSRTAVRGRDQHHADAATEQDASDLSVEVGSPVIRGRNWIYDENGAVIEYGEYVSEAGRWTGYDYEIVS